MKLLENKLAAAVYGRAVDIAVNIELSIYRI